jgi:hypothetical protein
MDASSIIQALGGPGEIAKATGWPYTTVDAWKRKGAIPGWRCASLQQIARDKGLDAVADAIGQIAGPARLPAVNGAGAEGVSC